MRTLFPPPGSGIIGGSIHVPSLPAFFPLAGLKTIVPETGRGRIGTCFASPEGRRGIRRFFAAAHS
ncbi:MAG: hypothetical protein C6W57_01380 [Caldibacillus debilis]|nr:MAG: hypothetical protein C6W57_01380 [Caldibacillus debilis]